MIDPEKYEWSKFDVVFYYDQPLEQVFRAWATGAGLVSFFIEKAHFETPDGRMRAPDEVLQTGDRYHWQWRQPFSVEGEVITVEADKEFSFTFGSMKVCIYFSRVDEQTELHLVQTEIPESADGLVFGHLNCRSCWVFFLTNLKAVLAAGLDLRDASPERVSAIEVGFQPLSSRIA